MCEARRRAQDWPTQLKKTCSRFSVLSMVQNLQCSLIKLTNFNLSWLCSHLSLCWVFTEAEANREISPLLLWHETLHRWVPTVQKKTGGNRRNMSNISHHQTIDSLRFSSCRKLGALTGGAAWRRNSLWSSTRVGGFSPETPETYEMGSSVSSSSPYNWLIRLQRSPSVSGGNSL